MKLLGIFFLLAVSSVQGKDECPAHSKENYVLLGCYEAHGKENLLYNDRKNINWANIEAYMHKLSCNCGRRAKEKNFAGFSLGYFGECYGKTKEELKAMESRAHKENKCVGDQKYVNCDKKKHEHCTGKEHAEAVYSFKTVEKKNVDGGLGEWYSWTKCSKDCGPGTQMRERNCDNPKPEGEGKDCTELGPLSEAQPCKLKECPVDGGYGPWKVYGPCSTTCGVGKKTRTRACNRPKPAHGGKDCTRLGPASEVASCNDKPCDGDGTGGSEENIGKVANKEECVVKCLEKSKNGKRANGATVDAAKQKSCYCEYGQTGRNNAASWLNTYIRPLDGGYGSWSKFGSCSKSCGGGQKTRNRKCNNPVPLGGGKDCSSLGPATESAPCNTFECPNFPLNWANGDGTGGSEENIGKVVNTAECIAKCSKRTRKGKLANGVTVDAATQRTCYCEYGQTGRSSSSSYRNTFIRPLDGGYGAWGSFGSCTKTCGGGAKARRRQCNNPAPLLGGKDCSRLGPAIESKPCNTFECPNFPLNWANGDGTGGSEENIGKVVNTAECIAKCRKRTRKGKLANGVTVDAATQRTCYCEYGQTGRSSSSSYRNTFIRPLDGGYGAWGSFGSCTKTCGGGAKARRRQCNNPAPLLGGKDCSRLGPAIESKPCNTFECPNFPLNWANGDGTGGSEENIGKVVNTAECIAKCRKRTRKGKLANGVTVDAATQRTCYCEYGQTGRSSSSSYRNTFIRPLDGGYSAWGAYGPCSKTCGGGTKTRTRQCNNPVPANAGRNCQHLGPSSQAASCNKAACPAVPTSWATGDGTGGSEEHIGKVKNKEECYMKCMTKMRSGKLANGVTVDAATGTSCYCEYGQTGRNGSSSWKNTVIRRS